MHFQGLSQYSVRLYVALFNLKIWQTELCHHSSVSFCEQVDSATCSRCFLQTQTGNNDLVVVAHCSKFGLSRFLDDIRRLSAPIAKVEIPNLTTSLKRNTFVGRDKPGRQPGCEPFMASMPHLVND